MVILYNLANAPADILSDIPLIEGLESTKATAGEIARAVAKGKETEIGINEAREVYRPVAAEASPPPETHPGGAAGGTTEDGRAPGRGRGRVQGGDDRDTGMKSETLG